jgi:trimeric autotransporter adhesin
VRNSGPAYTEIRRAFRLLFLLAALLAFNSNASAGTGQLVVNPPSPINFGSVSVGSSNTKSITLTNSGGPKITISQVSLSGTGFTLSGLNYPITLSGGQSMTGTVTFTPPSTGTDSGNVSIVVTQSSGGKKTNSSTSSTTVTVAMSGTGVSSTQVSVGVSPTSASIQTGGQQQFSASVSGTTNTAVTWTASGGSVSSNGLYTAPSSGGTYTVTATSAADTSKSASATVTVSQPIAVSLSPTSVNLQTGGQQQFSASVSGTTNTAVTWTTSGGTVSTSGLYTAPSSGGTYTVTATSAADTSKSASATITVSQSIAVSLSPTSASLQAGGQQQFTAYVSGTSNTAVNWSTSGGTITSGGLYTAPSTAGTYTVKAVSAADPTKSASASVAVSSQTVAISISPTSTALPEKWQQQFAATISGSTNTGVTWAVTQGTGTITQGGLYTAPQAVETDIVTVVSQADTTKSASAAITVSAPHSVSLSWSASTSSGISYYNVYRGTVSGGPYTLLKSGVTSTSYTDLNVQSGSTYYYVTTAVDSSGMESAYSGQAQAVIPMP